jgi:hypothetical protein
VLAESVLTRIRLAMDVRTMGDDAQADDDDDDDDDDR